MNKSDEQRTKTTTIEHQRKKNNDNEQNLNDKSDNDDGQLIRPPTNDNDIKRTIMWRTYDNKDSEWQRQRKNVNVKVTTTRSTDSEKFQTRIYPNDH